MIVSCCHLDRNEKDRYTLIEQSAQRSFQQLAFTISLAIAVNDICIKLRYICVYMMLSLLSSWLVEL